MIVSVCAVSFLCNGGRWIPSAAIVTHDLLFGKIFPHIQRAGRQDDAALDDVLHGGVDAQHGQRHEDDPQHEHAQDNAADLAGAADEGNAADDAGRDGVALVVEARRLGDGADTGALIRSIDSLPS